MTTDQVIELQGTPVLVCAPEGPRIAERQDVLDVIGACFSAAETAAIPVERLDESFFDLRSGFAGEMMQKFVNYHIHLVVVGDISGQVAGSDALRDLVYESNRGRHVWFVADLDELAERLKA